MNGVENRFKMQLLRALKDPHCAMGFQQPRTTSVSLEEEQKRQNKKDEADNIRCDKIEYSSTDQ